MPSTNSIHIKDLATDDRPRERAVKYGLNTLADAELIAIILGSGTRGESALELARRIYAQSGNNMHNLSRLSVIRLQGFKGVGQAKAITLGAALELGRRRMRSEWPDESRITRSSDVYDLVAPNLVDKSHEEVWLILMNQVLLI